MTADAKIGLRDGDLLVELIEEVLGRLEVTREQPAPRHEINVVEAARHRLKALGDLPSGLAGGQGAKVGHRDLHRVVRTVSEPSKGR